MTVVIPQQSRAAGTYRSTARSAGLLARGTINATGILSAASQQDASLAVTMALEANDDDTAGANDPNWYALARIDWEGGHAGRDGVFRPPALSYSSGVVSAALIRGLMILNKTVSLGIDVTVT